MIVFINFSLYPIMDYTTISVVSLKRMCKERNLRGYSNKKKNELISLLHHNGEEEKKSVTNNDDTQDKITLLKEEIKRLRASNLFLDIISSDAFDFIKNNINQKKPLHIASYPSGRSQLAYNVPEDQFLEYYFLVLLF